MSKSSISKNNIIFEFLISKLASVSIFIKFEVFWNFHCLKTIAYCSVLASLDHAKQANTSISHTILDMYDIIRAKYQVHMTYRSDIMDI